MANSYKLSQPDVYIIDLSSLDPQRRMSLFLDLKSRIKIRQAATVVLMPKNYQNLAAHMLDPGANNRMIQPIDAAK